MEWKIVVGVLIGILVLLYFYKPKKARFRIQRKVLKWRHYGSAAWYTTLALALCVIITALLGSALYWEVPDVGTYIWKKIWDLSIFDTICRTFKDGRLAESLLHGIKVVADVLDGEGDALRNGFPGCEWLTIPLCFAIPILAVATVILALLNGLPSYMKRRKKEYLIFSQVEEYSLVLAENMLKDRKEGRFAIFLRTDKEKLQPAVLGRLKKIKAATYPYAEEDLLRIYKKLRRKRLRFFFLSVDSDQSFQHMETLIDAVKENELFGKLPRWNRKQLLAEEEKGIFQQEMYLLSETESSALLIDRLRRKLCADDKGTTRSPVFAHTDLRLLDRYRTVTHHLLQKTPLYETADNKAIRVLILGLGRVGKAFFRGAISFCPMAGYETSFCICDQAVKKQWDDLRLQFPEIGEGYDVEEHPMDVESGEVLRLIDRKTEEGKPFTYVMLSMGDDERNIKVASAILKHYRKRQIEGKDTVLPALCINIENEIKSEYVSAFFAQETSSLSLKTFGADQSTFSEEVLLNRGLWHAARKLHKNLRRESTGYWSEYERRASVASAAHAAYHVEAIKSFSPAPYDEACDNLDDEQWFAMVDAEHQRWMNYARSEGMRFAPESVVPRIRTLTGGHKDHVSGMTPCLVETKGLMELFEDLYPDGKGENGEKKYPFIAQDECVVHNAMRLCNIVHAPVADDSKSEKDKTSLYGIEACMKKRSICTAWQKQNSKKRCASKPKRHLKKKKSMARRS